MASEPTKEGISDQDVIAYLREKGMIGAAAELEERITVTTKNDDMDTGTNEDIDTILATAPNNWCIVDSPVFKTQTIRPERVEEVKRFVDAFIDLQTKVLALPDHGCAQPTVNPLEETRRKLEAENSGNVEVFSEESSVAPTSVVVVSDDDTVLKSPPSEKPELLAVTFALLVLTYCELLDVGMESTASTIREAFEPVYDPIYKEQYGDLNRCKTTQDIKRVDTLNHQRREINDRLNKLMIQIADCERRINRDPSNRDPKSVELANAANHARRKFNEIAKHSARIDIPFDLAFLKNVRRLQWKISLASSTYNLLLALIEEPSKKLLLSKCRLLVEQRHPFRDVPPCSLDESKGKDVGWNTQEIRWAAPSTLSNKTMPFPKFFLDDEYKDEQSARKGKALVGFNRALLVNGFRRLEALERKRELDSLGPEATKRLKSGGGLVRHMSNALEPSVLMTTLTAASPEVKSRQVVSQADITAGWKEAGIEIICAKLEPTNGHKVAAACSDSSIRIWTAGSQGPEPTQTLIGHKDSLPAFDLDWARNGRSLLSAGGDGLIRLWDTMATGAKGELASPPFAVKPKQPYVAGSLVPGALPENAPYRNGAEIANFHGHSDDTPVWSVEFAPSGYYFVSAGGDSTARIWTTDRKKNVRLLAGHTARNVNCATWHPNCNYVLTGSDDKTARLWDVQSGRTVRYLSGSHGAIHGVRISPSGQYAALADRYGIVYLFDLASGKKVTEFRTDRKNKERMTHSMRFSQCGSALATAGDDCTIRLWDVRLQTIKEVHSSSKPHKIFRTQPTILFDLSFTRTNMLLAAGVFRNPIFGGEVAKVEDYLHS